VDRPSERPATPASLTRPLSLAALIAVFASIASIASPWSISIPPAHVTQSFGFQTPACWLVVIALLAAAVLELRIAVVAVAIATGTVIAWFGWAMLIVATPQFTALPFPFVGTDLIGGGWYAAAVGLLVVAAFVVRGLVERPAPAGVDLWIFTVIPGYGLMRLGEWGQGLTLALVFSGALYLASTDSPDPAVFADYGHTNNVPPPITREPEWILLTLAAAIWLFSVAMTVWRANRRRRIQPL
jgi:hypothetical protein